MVAIRPWPITNSARVPKKMREFYHKTLKITSIIKTEVFVIPTVSYYSQPVKTRKPLFHRHLKISP